MLFCGSAVFFVLIILESILRTNTAPCQKREAARPEMVATAKTRPAFLIIVSMMSWMTIWLGGDGRWFTLGIMSTATGPAAPFMIDEPGGGGAKLHGVVTAVV